MMGILDSHIMGRYGLICTPDTNHSEILYIVILGAVPPPAPRLHPNLAAIYKEKIANLIQALNDPNTLIEANTAIRQLIERVQLVPENGGLKIELYGELAALLKLGTEPKKKHPQAESEGVQITMVAGAGFTQGPSISSWV